MIWLALMQFLSMLFEWFRLGRNAEQEKDLEILQLRRVEPRVSGLNCSVFAV